MRKIIVISALFASVSVLSVGCLKDKGFDSQQYGINDPDKQPLGIGLPIAGTKIKHTIGLNAGSPTLQVVNNGLYIKILGGVAPTTDVHVVMRLNDVLRTDYNTANGTNIVTLPVAFYNIPTLTVTIPAGQLQGIVPINFPTTVPMDPLVTYGLGISIVSVDGNYVIAENMKNLLLEFTIKNKYDGNYGLRIMTTGWTPFGISDNAPATWPSATDGSSIFMITAGPNSVKMYDAWSAHDYFQVAFQTGNTTATVFGATQPRFIFDLATNALTNVVNDAADDGRGRAFQLNPAVTTSRYDPTEKKIYAAYLMKQNGRPDLFFFDTLTFKNVRP